MLLTAGFVLTTVCGLESSADNSNGHVVTFTSLTPQESASTQVNQTTIVSADAIVIAIVDEESFYIGRVKVERKDIPQRVSELLGDRPPKQQVIYIKAAATVRHGTVVSIIGSVRSIGIEQIGLITDRRDKESLREPQQRRMTQAGRRIIQAIQLTDGLIITVKAGAARNQRVEVNSMPLPLAELGATLREILTPRADKTVFIRAPEQTLYRDVMRIIGVVKAAGAMPVGLQVSEGQ